MAMPAKSTAAAVRVKHALPAAHRHRRDRARRPPARPATCRRRSDCRGVRRSGRGRVTSGGKTNGFQMRSSCSVTTTAFANAPAKTTKSTDIRSAGATSRVAMYTTSAAATVTRLASLSGRFDDVSVVTTHQTAIAAEEEPLPPRQRLERVAPARVRRRRGEDAGQRQRDRFGAEGHLFRQPKRVDGAARVKDGDQYDAGAEQRHGDEPIPSAIGFFARRGPSFAHPAQSSMSVRALPDHGPFLSTTSADSHRRNWPRFVAATSPRCSRTKRWRFSTTRTAPPRFVECSRATRA